MRIKINLSDLIEDYLKNHPDDADCLTRFDVNIDSLHPLMNVAEPPYEPDDEDEDEEEKSDDAHERRNQYLRLLRDSTSTSAHIITDAIKHDGELGIALAATEVLRRGLDAIRTVEMFNHCEEDE